MKLALFGGVDWVDQATARAVVKRLPPAAVVYLDTDPFSMQASVMRQCRCSGVVAVAVQLPGNGTRIVEARRARDRVMLEGADKVWIFGSLAPDREANIAEVAKERGGLLIERRSSAGIATQTTEPEPDEDDDEEPRL